MTNNLKQQTLAQAVTEMQLAACTRVIDEGTGEVFYMVESATTAETCYYVRALFIHGRYYVTCTCPAGENGVPCWHKRAAIAHAQEYKLLQTIRTRFEMVDVVHFAEYHMTQYHVKPRGEDNQEVQILYKNHNTILCGCKAFYTAYPFTCQHKEFVKAYLDEFHSEYEQWKQETGQESEVEG